MKETLLILDIDGVMTDGTKVYDTEAKVIAKRYCDLDFTAIKRFKAVGYNVCFLSGDSNINQKMAEKRNVDFYHSRTSDGTIDKKAFIPIFEERYGVKKENMIYVGDDYFDLDIINELRYTFCPINSPSIVKDSVFKVLDRRSGEGVIAVLYDYLETIFDFKQVSREDLDDLDKNEKF